MLPHLIFTATLEGIYKWGNWDCEKLTDLPRVIQLIRVWGRIQTSDVPNSTANALSVEPSSCLGYALVEISWLPKASKLSYILATQGPPTSSIYTSETISFIWKKNGEHSSTLSRPRSLLSLLPFYPVGDIEEIRQEQEKERKGESRMEKGEVLLL